jgi:3-methyladenine DNA glycosylase/8-oxoguanine DNA glycosylase
MPGKKAARDNDGLTWLEAVQKQDARRKKRENDIADKVLKEEWVSASAHHQILANLTAKMETAPDKIKTELGLTIAQRDRIQKILDELRFDAAAETRRTFIAAKKQVEDAKTA